MASAAEGGKDRRSDAVRQRLKQAVAEMLAGTGLEIRELDHELVIFNPRDLDQGQIHVSYADLCVSWERVIWDYWGPLEGFAEADDQVTTIAKIIEALTS